MRPMTPALFLFSFLWIVGGSYLLSRLFCPAVAAGAATSSFSIIDGNFKATTAGTFGFKKSTSTIAIAPSAEKEIFAKTGTYLKDNPDKMLALTGYFGSGESNDSEFGNLGIARAEAFKEVLVENGANADQITTTGEEKLKATFVDKKLNNDNVIGFAFSDNASASEVGNTFNFDESKTVFFEPDQVNFPADDPKLLEIIDYLESYLTTNPDAIVTVNAYTDNQGSSKDKMKIASKRADRVRRILRNYKKGKVFTSPMVIINAVGPQDPQADNETAEGMAINNRVTLTVE